MSKIISCKWVMSKIGVGGFSLDRMLVSFSMSGIKYCWLLQMIEEGDFFLNRMMASFSMLGVIGYARILLGVNGNGFFRATHFRVSSSVRIILCVRHY